MANATQIRIGGVDYDVKDLIARANEAKEYTVRDYHAGEFCLRNGQLRRAKTDIKAENYNGNNWEAIDLGAALYKFYNTMFGFNVLSDNLLFKNPPIDGFFSNGHNDNNSSMSYMYVPFIPVTAGTTYRSNLSLRFVAFFDSNKAYVSNVTYVTSFTPAQTGYVHVTVQLYDDNGTIQRKNLRQYKLYVDGTDPDTLVPFFGKSLQANIKLFDEVFKAQFDPLFAKSFEESVYDAVKPIARDIVAEYGKYLPVHYRQIEKMIPINIVPADEWVIGYFNPDGSINTSSDTYKSSTVYIPVEPSTTYYIRSSTGSGGAIVRKMVVYNEDYEQIIFLDNVYTSFTTQATAKYIRISLYRDRDIQIFKTPGTQINYDPDVYLIPFENIESSGMKVDIPNMNFGIYKKSSNLYPEFKHPVTRGWHMSSAPYGIWEATQNYNFSDYVPIPASKKIITNIKYRGIAFYSDLDPTEYAYNPVAGEKETNGTYQGYMNVDTPAKTVRDLTNYTASAGAKYMRFWLYPADSATVDAAGFYVGDAENYDHTFSEHYFDPFWISSDKIMIKGESGGSSDAVEIINAQNSDRIGMIGDSYTESHYTVQGKAHINKLALFSDYVFENFAVSGDIYYGQIDKIRNNVSKYGTTYNETHPKYCMMLCFTNDIKTLSMNEFADALRSACDQVIGSGGQPIICTEYHSTTMQSTVISVQHQIAREYGCPCWDISPIVSLIRGTDYAPFWGGSHPGTRPNAIESDNYEKFLETLERPRKSMKLFRLRSGYTFDNLNNLIYWNNEERAEMFKEINCGHTYITNPAEVDNCTTSVQTNQISEYASLIKHNNVAFNNLVLACFVIPGTGHTTSSASLFLTASKDVTVYVRDISAGSYTRPVRYMRFDFGETITTMPTVGAVYTDPSIVNNGTPIDLTVVEITYGTGDGSAIGSIWCSGSFGNLNFNNQAGTMTKKSGTGDSTIAYSYKAIGYRNLSGVKLGGWTEVEYDDDLHCYPIPYAKIPYTVARDRIDFLITGSGSFNISDIYMEWTGRDDKAYIRKEIDIISNVARTTTELFSQTTFGPAGSPDSYWGVTPTTALDSCYPVGCSSLAVVNSSNVIQKSLQASSLGVADQYHKGELILEVWARYFPPIYTDGSGNQITVDSYDYAKLNVEFGTSNYNKVTLHERVNTHWKLVQFPIDVSYLSGNPVTFKFFSNKDLQIAKISMKRK